MSKISANAFDLVPISDFCETGSGGTPSRTKASQYFGGSIPWVKSGELRESVITSTEETITELGLKESAAKLLPKDALLVALYGATVGRIGILGVNAATNQAICHIIPDDRRANRKYLFYALQAQVPYWLSKRVGVGQPNISQGVIKDTKIPLPLLPAQERIADILEKADTIRRKRLTAEQQHSQFRNSLFHWIVGTGAKGFEKWPLTPITDLGEVRGGIALSGRRADHSRQVPYLRVANVYRDRLELLEIKKVGLTEDELERTRLQLGDVLIVEGHGNRDEVGRSAVWDSSIIDCVHQNHLIRVRTNRNTILPDYLSCYLNASEGRRQLFRHGKTTSGLNTISISNVRETTVRVPPIECQERFVQLLNAHGHGYRMHVTATEVANDVFSSLVQRAFKGEL